MANFDPKECICCFTKAPNLSIVTYSPCQHKIACLLCTLKLMTLNWIFPCPLCRQPVKFVIDFDVTEFLNIVTYTNTNLHAQIFGFLKTLPQIHDPSNLAIVEKTLCEMYNEENFSSESFPFLSLNQDQANELFNTLENIQYDGPLHHCIQMMFQKPWVALPNSKSGSCFHGYYVHEGNNLQAYLLLLLTNHYKLKKKHKICNDRLDTSSIQCLLKKAMKIYQNH